MKKLKTLFDTVLMLLFTLTTDATKARVVVRLLEELCKKTSLSETSVAIVASSLGQKTSAKRPRPAKKGKKKTSTKSKKKTIKSAKGK